MLVPLAQALSNTRMAVAIIGALLVVIGLAYLAAGFVRVVLAPRRESTAPGACPSCGYNLAGISGPCPECGHLAGPQGVALADQTQTRQQLGAADRWFTRGVCFCMLGFVIAVASSFA